jgi:hypothetical protein
MNGSRGALDAEMNSTVILLIGRLKPGSSKRNINAMDFGSRFLSAVLNETSRFSTDAYSTSSVNSYNLSDVLPCSGPKSVNWVGELGDELAYARPA